uniref:RGS domain-containing protein n=1 Tax=Mola mola TaxID=94237 RepID=A0A3Q3VRY4_MOLML
MYILCNHTFGACETQQQIAQSYRLISRPHTVIITEKQKHGDGHVTGWRPQGSSFVFIKHLLGLRSALEDARSWSTSFEKVMKSAAGRSCFRQFLRTEFSEENMMFWLACEELKNETNKTVVEEKVRQIYEDFISILSPKEVSLDSHVRDLINRNMLEPTSHTFEEAQQQIYTLMQRDSYPRYINSAVYTDLLKSLEDICWALVLKAV